MTSVIDTLFNSRRSSLSISLGSSCCLLPLPCREISLPLPLAVREHSQRRATVTYVTSVVTMIGFRDVRLTSATASNSSNSSNHTPAPRCSLSLPNHQPSATEQLSAVLFPRHTLPFLSLLSLSSPLPRPSLSLHSLSPHSRISLLSSARAC